MVPETMQARYCMLFLFELHMTIVERKKKWLMRYVDIFRLEAVGVMNEWFGKFKKKEIALAAKKNNEKIKQTKKKTVNVHKNLITIISEFFWMMIL